MARRIVDLSVALKNDVPAERSTTGSSPVKLIVCVVPRAEWINCPASTVGPTL